MKRLLFIGPDHGSAVGGREQLSRLHRGALEDLLGRRLDIFLIPRRSLSGMAALRAVVSGRIDGTDRLTERRVLAHIADRDIKYVWLDGSNLGVLARAIKRQFPSVKVATFFHNVETRFFLGALRHRPRARAIGIVAATYFAERMAVQASDCRLALSQRDSHLLRRLYGRGATSLLPMAIPSPARPTEADSPPPITGPYLLFVGGGFYANKAGIQWYARNVAPRLSIPTLVIGRGLDPLRSTLDSSQNIRLIGEVDDLAPYYRHATAVVAPIFDGSGMKTKVAEALMHGKRVIGTHEAFVGYEDALPQAGWQCNSAEEFVLVLNDIVAIKAPRIELALRACFDRFYSLEATRHRLSSVIFASLDINETGIE